MPSRKTIIAGLALALASAFLATTALSPAAVAAEQAQQNPAAAFVQQLGDTALLTLTDKKMTRSAREDRARDILRKNFDVQTIGRFALGTYWRQATDAEREEYIKLFETMIVRTYATRFEEYSGQSFKVDGARADGEKDSLVQSRILQNGGPPVSVEWRVRNKEGQMKVVDVIVENISMTVTQRSDFSAVIQRGGGKVSALLDSMRKRTR
jgi:phospholipid transport system substrate-binding protein